MKAHTLKANTQDCRQAKAATIIVWSRRVCRMGGSMIYTQPLSVAPMHKLDMHTARLIVAHKQHKTSVQVDLSVTKNDSKHSESK